MRDTVRFSPGCTINLEQLQPRNLQRLCKTKAKAMANPKPANPNHENPTGLRTAEVNTPSLDLNSQSNSNDFEVFENVTKVEPVEQEQELILPDFDLKRRH